MNAKEIANERNDFLPVFQSLVDFVSIEDIYSDKKERSQQQRSEPLCTNESGEPSNNDRIVKMMTNMMFLMIKLLTNGLTIVS